MFVCIHQHQPNLSKHKKYKHPPLYHYSLLVVCCDCLCSVFKIVMDSPSFKTLGRFKTWVMQSSESSMASVMFVVMLVVDKA